MKSYSSPSNKPMNAEPKAANAKPLNRRGFLKVVAGVTAATGLAPAAKSYIVEPYVNPPAEELPGQAAWYASTCGQCPAGCGIVVRTINGRAKKIEGNPLHPLNRGKLCARGQAGLQVLYNPDRLRNAVRQTGGRGSRQFEPLYWPEALDLLSEKIATLGSPKRLAFLSGLMPSHLYRSRSAFARGARSGPAGRFRPALRLGREKHRTTLI
jgi:anaerobic selenocysteine-containing dehydrogenase